MKKIIALFFTLSLLSSLSLAEEGKKPKEPSAEDRKKMAELHQKMADCLKSDKPIQQCHEEMKKSCKEMGDHCPMGHHPGRMHGGHHMKGGHHGDHAKGEHQEEGGTPEKD